MMTWMQQQQQQSVVGAGSSSRASEQRSEFDRKCKEFLELGGMTYSGVESTVETQ